MLRSYIAMGTLCGLTLIVAGCSSPHYRVTDPASGKEYFTTKVQEAGKGGAVKIKDGNSGSMVTLQSSEVKEISGDDYDAGIAAQQAKAQAVHMKPASMQPASAQPVPLKPVEAQPAPVQPNSVQPAQ